MIVNMSEKATEEQITHIIERIREAGYQPHVTRGVERTIVAAVGSGRRHEIEALQVAPGVENVVAIAQPFKLVSRQVKPERSIVNVRGVRIGGSEIVIIAGPCSVESREQLLNTAHAVKSAGATMLRGGAYKPRTSPYDFQGLGVEALKILGDAREQTGLPVVTEVMGTEDVRAWHQNVRNRNAQYFRSCRRGSGPRPFSSARDCRSFARDRQAESDCRSLSRCCRSGSRRIDHRSASLSGAGALRRRAVARF